APGAAARAVPSGFQRRQDLPLRAARAFSRPRHPTCAGAGAPRRRVLCLACTPPHGPGSPMSQGYDEMHDAQGNVRAHYAAFDDWLRETPESEIERKRREAEVSFHRV